MTQTEEATLGAQMLAQARSEGHRRALPQGRNIIRDIAKGKAQKGEWATLAKAMPDKWTGTLEMAQILGLELQSARNALYRMASHGLIDSMKVEGARAHSRMWRAAQ